MKWPFESDTSGTEIKLAERSLSANKRRNRLAGIIIFSASFLLSFTTVLLCNATIYGRVTYGVNNSNEVLITVFGISVILLFTGGLTVKNIFYVSVLQRTHEFAQLRTVGATYRQIVSVMNGERKRLTRKFMFFGLSAGLFCSLILSGVLMFIIFTVMYAVNVEKLARQPYQENSDLYVQLNSSPGHSSYDLMKDSPFTSALHQEISSIPGVESIYILKMLNCVIFNADAGEGVGLAIESILNESGFANLVIEGNMPAYKESFHTIPVVVNRASYYYEKSGLTFSIGDNIQALIDTGYSDQNVQLEVCGFIEDKDTGVVLYTNSEYFDSISEMNTDLVWYICTEKNRTHTVVSEVEALMSHDSRVYIEVLENDLSFYKAFFHNAKVVISVLTVLVSLFAFVNLLNTCITNTVVRSHEFALLEAVGMTKTQISDMQGTEYFIYFVGSFISGQYTDFIKIAGERK